MKRLLLLLLPVIAMFAMPAAANASYTISKADAQYNARGIARQLYSAYGVTLNRTSSSCRPQSTTYEHGYAYHRWVCGWATKTPDGDYVAGALLVAGQTDGSYSYKVLRGIHYV